MPKDIEDMETIEVTDDFTYEGTKYKEGEACEVGEDIPEKGAESAVELDNAKKVEKEPPEVVAEPEDEGFNIEVKQRFKVPMNLVNEDNFEYWGEEETVEEDGKTKLYAKEGHIYSVPEQLPENVGKSALNKGFAEEIENLGTSETIGAEEGDEEDKGISPKMVNLLHKRYQDVWGEDYDVEKESYLDKKFGKKHTNSLTKEEAKVAIDDLEKRMNQKEVKEKAEDEVRSDTGQALMQKTKEKEGTGEKGVSIDEAREMAKTMGSPQMVKDLIDGMDFEDLKQYIWDPDENPDLPYDTLEPKVSLYELVHPLWEAYTGWSYNIEDFEFNKNEEDDVYECKVTIVREGGPSDPTTISFTKTKKKENLMRQRDINEGMEKEQWKEFLESLAYKRAMRPQMRLWVDKFVNAYRKATKQKR